MPKSLPFACLLNESAGSQVRSERGPAARPPRGRLFLYWFRRRLNCPGEDRAHGLQPASNDGRLR